MPSTLLGGWYQSFSSIHKSVNHLIQTITKTDFESSPYISAIQSLNGRTPGEKYRDLNAIVQGIVSSAKERGEFIDANDLREVSPAMTPLVRIIAGVELKLHDVVLEALKSEDSTVVRKALSADWFFDGANANVTATNFAKNVLPYVSLRTMNDIVRKLARSLLGHEKKAREFFEALTEMYGVERSLSLLPLCEESFIFDAILRHKIVLPEKMLSTMYDKYPNLVIRYLQLGNKNNVDNVEERKVHEIWIGDYDRFLPRLVQNHPMDFVQLYELTPEKAMKLGNTRSEYFLKNCKNVIIERPRIFLKLVPLKILNRHLTREQFDTMYENLFPQDIQDFEVNEMVDYLIHYQHDKYRLLKDKFNKKYNKDLFDVESCSTSPRLWKILPTEEREEIMKSLLNKTDKKSLYETYITFQHPSLALPIFIEKIGKSSITEERVELIGRMILCCSVWDSKEDLQEVLQYYNERHKNEQHIVLCRFFEHVKEQFDLKTLDKNHWHTFQEIISHAYVKKELFQSHITLIESILEAALYNAIRIDQKDNKAYLNFIFDLIVECKIEESSPTWNVLKEKPELERECIATFFQLIPLKYPESHNVWKTKNDRLARTLSIVKTINDYNERNSCIASRKKSSRKSMSRTSIAAEKKIKIEDYPWIQKLAEEFFSRSETSYRKKRLMKLLKRNAPEYYETKIDEFSTIRDIENGEALALLRQNPKRILANWPDYLAESRELLHNGSKAARRFVSAIKWYHEIPVKFVERCLIELKDEGSILVLGILLEGSVFQTAIEPFVPTAETFSTNKKDAKENYELARSILKAMKYTNPPVSFEVVDSFCQGDYVTLTESTLITVTHRMPVDRVLAFAKKLVDKPITVKKQGIRLVQNVATKAQLKDFLEDIWKKESNPSIRQTIQKMVFDIFARSPNPKNWELIRSCIDGLTADHKGIIERFSDVEVIDPSYLGNYIDAYLSKLEKLSEEGLDMNTRTKCVCLLIESIDDKRINFLPEKTGLMILNKYFFDMDSLEISRVAQNFAVRYYLLQAGAKFEPRLKAIINILRKVMERFDTPHPKRPRFYAANYTIHEFFADVLTEISSSECDRSLEIVESMLKVLGSVLSPWQEPSSYLSYNLYREYLVSHSPQDFGSRCAKRISGFVEDFAANESIISDVTRCLDDFMQDKIFRKIKNSELRLMVVEGLLEGDDFYGYLVGAKLLNGDVESYDHRYDVLIKNLRTKQNKAIQYNLYKHLNRIRYHSDN